MSSSALADVGAQRRGRAHFGRWIQVSAALPTRGLDLLLTVYQQGVSPLLGPRCRFEPSCSAYAREALAVHGAGRGLALTTWRLLRCQPFGTPGFDPVPMFRGAHSERRPGAGGESAPGPEPCHRETHRVNRGAHAC